MGIEVTLCLFGDSDRVLAFIFFRHGAIFSIAGCGRGQEILGEYLIVCRENHSTKIGGGRWN